MTDLFARVVCGLDGTSESLEALRQAAFLAHEGSQLNLVMVDNAVTIAAATAPATGVMVPPPMPAAEAGGEWLDAGQELLRRDFPALRHVEKRLLEGPVLPTLLRELADWKATVAAVGRHGHSRLAGLVVGSVATTLLHEAPCSVLVTGKGTDFGADFPRTITVGFDGSEQADHALERA